MKKTYISPSMKAHKVNITKILAGSLNTPQNKVGSGTQLSNQMGSIIEDDEEE